MESSISESRTGSPFIFINSSKHRPTQTKEDSFTIASHVSKTHRARLKQERLRRLQESTKNSFALRLVSPNTASAEPGGHARGPALIVPGSYRDGADGWGFYWPMQRDQNPSYEGQPQPRSLRSMRSQHVFLSQEGQESPKQESVGFTQPRPPRGPSRPRDHEPSLVLWKGNSDPFSSTAVPLDAHNNGILRLAQGFFIFTAWPDSADAVFRTTISDTKNSHIRLDDVTQDPGQLHAILASGCRVRSRLTASTASPSQAMELAHKTRAVSLLRQRLLSRGLTSSIIPLVRLLISLDFDGDDHEGALVHLRGLLAMAISLPGLFFETEGFLLVSDVWVCMSLLKRPEIWPERYDPGDRAHQPFDPLLARGNDDASLSLFEIHPNSQSYPGLDARSILLLDSAIDVVKTKHRMAKLDNQLQQHVVKWMHRRATAVCGYLMIGHVDAIESSRAPDQPASVKIQQALIASACLAGILFMNLEFCESPSNYNFSQPFKAIESTLRSVAGEIEQDESNVNDELYLWLLFMCTIGNDVYAARRDLLYSPWSFRTFHHVRTRLKLKTMVDVKHVLDKFLYHAAINDDFLRGLLSTADRTPTSNIIAWSEWCTILNHYVREKDMPG